MTTAHIRFMRVALSLAQRGLGQTWPNPSVGAVVVKNSQIIATAFTAKGGRPHAETQALDDAGAAAVGATLYVTLEPCSHTGQTLPCTDAIIKAGITTVVVATGDKNPQVNGGGIAALKKAGITVIEHMCEDEAREMNCGFFSVIEKNRPYVSLKIATSLDGKIASPHSRWLTGDLARSYGHLLRANHDAILTGSGTVLADDPELTCRLPGLETHSPIRIVLDRKGRLPASAKILQAQDIAPTWVLHEKTLPEALDTLTQKGITRLMVEAGGTLTTKFLHSGLVDKIYWFRAPIIVGSDRPNAVGDGFHQTLQNFAPKAKSVINLGIDTLEIITCSRA